MDYGLLERLTGYAVRRAQLAITEAFDAAMAGEGLRTQRFSALVLIARNPGLSQAELAGIMGIDPPQTSVVADALVKLGLVERRRQEHDRRSRRLFPTSLTDERLPRIEARVVEHDDSVMALPFDPRAHPAPPSAWRRLQGERLAAGWRTVAVGDAMRRGS